MSNISKNRQKTINLKGLILKPGANIELKYLELSTLKQLLNTCNKELTERTRRPQKIIKKLGQSEISKTSREYNHKNISKIIFNRSLNKTKFISHKTLNKNKLNKRNNNYSLGKNKFISREENRSSLNNLLNYHGESNRLRNSPTIEYSDIKPKKRQKYIKINNIGNFDKTKLINKLFENPRNLKLNLSRNNNFNISGMTNLSNTFNDNEIYNLTQRNISYKDNKKIISSIKNRMKVKHSSTSKSKNKIKTKNSKLLEDLILNESYNNKNSINSKLKENLNIFKNNKGENRINLNNNNTNRLKKKQIHILIKQEKNFINHILPQREKLFNNIKKNYIINNKFKFNKPTINKNSTEKKGKNTKTIIKKNNNSDKKFKENKQIIKNNNNILYKNPRIKNNINNLNIKYNNKTTKINQIETKNIIFSPTPQITKENTITIKDSIPKKISKIDSCTLAGYISSEEQKINQDNYFIKKNFLNEKEQYFIGVCDGHGDNGHFISSYIAQSLPNFLADSSDKNIISSFNSLNNNLVQNSNIDCSLSGSTCSSIIINPEKIISINLGDSRAILAKEENGIYKTINLSIDHKPKITSEKNRILINGGRVKPFYDDKNKQFLGPDRVWLKTDDLPGLAMTRSFGDTIAHMVGVISEPEIKKYEFTGNEKFIVIGSDGIWEYITSEECVNIVKEFYDKNMNINGAINCLMNEAFNRWKKYDEIVDDITAIIIFFEK